MQNDQGYILYNVDRLPMPVLVSVPHAGRDYPGSLFENLRLAPEILIRLEDRYADLLAREAINNQFTTIIAHRARAWIDLNRDENDIDTEMVDGLDRANLPVPSAKQRGGLGLIPRRLSGAGDIWRGRFGAADVMQRISSFHQPYHATISDILHRIRDKYGAALLLDVHSMPPIHPKYGETAPRIVIGDQYGRSASSVYSEILREYAENSGVNAALNHPYSGEYILQRHGNVHHNIHAIQLEIDRSLYLDEILREPGNGLPVIANMIGNMAQILSEELLGKRTLLAAE